MFTIIRRIMGSGQVLMLSAAMLFFIGDFLTRVAAEKIHDPIWVLFCRLIVGILCFLIIQLTRKQSINPSVMTNHVVAFRAILYTITISLFAAGFFVNNKEMASTYVASMFWPLYVMVAGWLFYGEKFKLWTFLLNMLITTGVLVYFYHKMVAGEVSVFSGGFLLGIGSGVGYASIVLIARKIKTYNFSSMEINLPSMIYGCLILLMFLPFRPVVPVAALMDNGITIILAGVASFAGLIALTVANEKPDQSKIAPLDNAVVLYGFLSDIAAGSHPDVMEIGGVAIIGLCILLLMRIREET